MTGSSLPSRARAVRSTPNCSRAGFSSSPLMFMRCVPPGGWGPRPLEYVRVAIVGKSRAEAGLRARALAPAIAAGLYVRAAAPARRWADVIICRRACIFGRKLKYYKKSRRKKKNQGSSHCFPTNFRRRAISSPRIRCCWKLYDFLVEPRAFAHLLPAP